MAGANIFMIYSNAAGTNVTLSPRLGVGEQQPLSGSSTSDVTLLEGSGILNGMMIANVRCEYPLGEYWPTLLTKSKAQIAPFGMVAR